MTAPAPPGPNIINNHIAKRAPSRHDNTLQTAVGARDPPSHLEDRRSLLPTRLPAGRAVPAVERDVGLDLLAVGPAVTHEEGLARADHELAQESLVPNFRSGELTNRCLKVRSIPST